MPENEKRSQFGEGVVDRIVPFGTFVGRKIKWSKEVIKDLEDSDSLVRRKKVVKKKVKKKSSTGSPIKLSKNEDIHSLKTIQRILEDEMGFLFLDQVRLQPKETVIGENIFSMSLAPQETTTISQRSYTKETTTITDENIDDVEVSNETDSSNSSELSQVIESEMRSSEQKSLNASISGKYGGIGGSVEASISGSISVDSMSTDSTNHAHKSGQEFTRKAAVKSRKQHKTEFKMEKESFIENSSSRTIKNMNTDRSLMLKYYKVFQEYLVSIERVGVRLCWAPFVYRPGRFVLGAMRVDPKMSVDYDPITELMKQVVSDRIPEENRDISTEVIKWHEAFEWDGATYKLYPSWWSKENESFLGQSTNFVNASYARVFLPIRPGYEVMALSLLLSRSEEIVERKFLSIINDIKNFQKGIDDGTREIKIGELFTEYAPTDGTYLEPALGSCSAIDDLLKKDIDIDHLSRMKEAGISMDNF